MKAPFKIKTVRRRIRGIRALYGEFGDLLVAERRLLGLALLALVGETVFQLLAPFPMKYIFDGLLLPDGAELIFVPNGFPERNPALFLGIQVTALMLLPLAASQLAYRRTIWSATAGQRMVMGLRQRLFAHMQSLSLRFHSSSRLGDLLMRVTGDIPLLRDALSQSLIDLTGQIGVVVVTSGVLFVIDARLALVSLAVLIGVSSLSAVFSRRVVKVVRKQRAQEGVLACAASESLTTIPQVKAMAREAEVAERFSRLNRVSLRSGLKSTKLQASLSRWVEGIFGLGIAVIVLLGVLRILAGGGMTPGDLLVFVALVRRLNKPLRRISRTAGRIGKAAACGERVMEILSVRPEEVDAPWARPVHTLRGEIEVQNVRFSYNGDDPILDGIDLRIPAGQCVAFVGRNGAGKTTLMHLLLRFYEPSSGRLKLDGKDPRGFTLRSLREQFSVALQDTYLFEGTVRENLLFCAPDSTDEQMIHSLEEVGAEFVNNARQGLDFPVGEGGAGMSGGQRRKLVLAGVLLRSASILILDEPTAHIDGRSRRDILDRLPRIQRGRTTLIITHDPEVVARADRVIHIEDGRVAAEGSHEYLWRRDADYRALFPSRPNSAELGRCRP